MTRPIWGWVPIRSVGDVDGVGADDEAVNVRSEGAPGSRRAGGGEWFEADSSGMLPEAAVAREREDGAGAPGVSRRGGRRAR